MSKSAATVESALAPVGFAVARSRKRLAMELVAKRFNELSLDEYHELLKLRCAVFLVEQQSPYQEVDDADKEAIHLYFRNDEGALAALRAGCCRPASRTRRPPSGASSPWSADAAWVVALWKRPSAWPSRNWTPTSSLSRPRLTPRAFTRSSVSCAPPTSLTTAGIMHVEMKLAR